MLYETSNHRYRYQLQEMKGWPYKDKPNKKRYQLCRSFDQINSKNYCANTWLLIGTSNDLGELEQQLKETMAND